MRPLFVCLCLVFIFSCKKEITYQKLAVSSDDLLKTWRLTEVTFDDDFYNSTDSHEKKVLKGQVSLGFLFTFFPDQTATKLVDNKFEMYKWTYTSDSLLILKNEINADTFKVLSIEENKGYRFLECRYRNIGEYKFLEEYSMLSDITQDPYHPSLNVWRTPALSYETSAQLKSRIMNYLDHYKALLKSSMERTNSKIRLKSSKGPLRIFDGGIGLVAKDQLPKKWLYTYFSDSQGYEVYDKLSTHFKKRIINKKTANGWRMDDYVLIDSLQTIY